MYAVISSGGKQHRVAEGDTIEVELVGDEGTTLTLQPLMIVDGKKVVAGKDAAKGKVTAKVTGTTRGRKVTGFTYKNKTNSQRNWGHRQSYSTIEITKISAGSASKSKAEE